MADEITINLRFSATKNGATAESGTVAVVADMAGTDMTGWTTGTATNSSVALALPSPLAYPANVSIQNLGGVAIGVYQDSGATALIGTLPVSSDPPNDSIPMLIPGAGATLYVKTAASTSLYRAMATEV